MGGRVKFLSDLANDAKNVPQHHFGFSNVTNHNWSVFCTHVKKKKNLFTENFYCPKDLIEKCSPPFV